jgi:alcohol dehydrogenase (cytochrome c)
MSFRYVTLLSAAAILASPFASAQTLFTGSGSAGGNATAGQTVYSQACIGCHGPKLEGSPFAPTLVGETFMSHWRGKTQAEFLTQMRNTMPPKGAGVVKQEAYPDLMAFLVKVNLEGPPNLAVAPPPAAVNATTATTMKPLPPELARKLEALTPVTEAMLAAPPEADWLMWRRTFDAAGFSPLKQIDRGNVQRLQKVWSLPIDPSSNEITPLVHDGVLFVFSGSGLQAIDAASGKPLWRYEREFVRPNFSRGQGDARRQSEPRRQSSEYGGQRKQSKSVALYGHSLLVPTSDGHLLALDARSGKVLWDHAINGDAPNGGLQLSSGPLVARGVVMIGASLGLTNKGGCFIVGLDANTGEERWRFYTVARPGSPGGDSWNDAPVEERFGGGVWTTGSYDHTLNLAYFGVGNTYNTATLLEPRAGAGGVTKNDGLYTNTTLALRPETGELVWHHQHHRRDVWDQDWAFERTVVTLGSGANAKRAVVTGGKAAIFEALDAATGKFLFAQDNGLTNLFAGIDAATGDKRINAELEPVGGKPLLLCPSNLGARNWPATSLNPATGTLFVETLESCADYTYPPRGRQETANGGTDIRFSPRFRPDSDGNLGRVMAIDLNTQRVTWTHRQRLPMASSLLATAGGVVFISDLGRKLSAFDQTSGKVLWETQLPAAAESTPVTYSVGGRQYIAVVSGEGSHLGTYSRGLLPELSNPKTEISLIVFALPGK